MWRQIEECKELGPLLMAKSEYSIYVRQYEKCSVVCVVTKKSTIAVVIEAEVTLNSKNFAIV